MWVRPLDGFGGALGSLLGGFLVTLVALLELWVGSLGGFGGPLGGFGELLRGFGTLLGCIGQLWGDSGWVLEAFRWLAC